MTTTFNQWLVDLAKNEQFSLLETLPHYLTTHYNECGDKTVERVRLVNYFTDYAPKTSFSRLVLEAIKGRSAF